MLRLEKEKEDTLKEASRKIKELNELRLSFELGEINGNTFAEMATSKLKKTNALLEKYRQGIGVYWN